MITNFRVLHIVTPDAEKEYPAKYREDTKEFPHLIEVIEDEADIFVMDMDRSEWYPAKEFFHMVSISEFKGEILPDMVWP